ncbi:hypothetical protein BAE44_0025237 [Dichanthelium oligosanthes]|uniref:Uncharacterized protein n=1 Tax=Dichanthelium oligosanthes TaxID=888268 RepID=A0A1E5ULJ5_9POAL|nr:hypothetical protein BAE44_0025237 [Dichanthelium oligosanthes]
MAMSQFTPLPQVIETDKNLPTAASCATANMKATCGKMVLVPVLAVLVALAVAVTASAAAVDPPKPRGQQVHLFEATVRVPDRGGDDPEEYNYRLLAQVLGRLPGSLISPNKLHCLNVPSFYRIFNLSVEAARSVMYETELGLFSAFLTNNQARRLSSESSRGAESHAKGGPSAATRDGWPSLKVYTELDREMLCNPAGVEIWE